MTNDKKQFFSAPEVAKILKISRNAVFKKIKAGQIQAQKVGRNYIISRESLLEIMGQALSPENKAEIDKAVEKAVKEYGETFKLLGKE